MTAPRALLAGLALSAAALLIIGAAPADALRAWLAAAFLGSGLPFGSLGMLMIMRLTGGAWDEALPPFLEAGALTLPLSFLTLLPVLLGMGLLYPWVSHPTSGFQGWWLAPVPFVLRTLLLYLGTGLALWALVVRRGPAQAIASAGLLFFMPMMTMVLVDWLLSSDPRFHSSGFAFYAMSVQFTVGFAAAVVLLLDRQPERTTALGAILITLVLLWLYLAFTHYIIIWSGNLADSVGWYKARGVGGWGIACAFVATVEAVAFLVLIFPTARSSAPILRAVAIALLVSKLVEAAWLVLPYGGAARPAALALYLLAAAGLGLVFIPAQMLLLKRRMAARVPA